MNPSANLNIVDLFSGIGGFSLGLHRADPRFKTIAFCEIEPFCQEVLKQNFPGVTLYNDIKDTKITDPTFLVCGGFPCQGFSQAGLQRGTEDDRYLWGEMFDVIKHTKPRWVIAENVRGIVTTQDGLAFNQVHSDLESENYEVQTFNLPAICKGAWHKRERIWFIANTNSNQYWSKIRGVEREKKEIQREYREKDSTTRKFSRTDNGPITTNTNSGEQFGCNDASGIHQTEQQRMVGNEEKDRNKVWSKTERCSEVSGLSQNISDTECEGLERHSKHSATISRENKGLHFGNEDSRNRQDAANTDNTGCEKQWQSESDEEKQQTTECSSWWQIESKFRGVPYGITTELDKDRTKRLKALGNGVVPQIVEEIGRAIIKAEFGNG